MDNCDHLHESLRGRDWKEDSKRMTQIQKAEKKQRMKEAIERSRKRVMRKRSPSTSPETTTANQANMNQYQSGLASIALASAPHPPSNSWVLDSAATDHIFNNLSLLHDYRPSTAPHKLEAGTQALNIHGYGTAYTTIQTLNGPTKLRLNNVAYIPGFLANLVCFRRLQNKGIQWDTATGHHLDHNGDHICKLLDHYGLWLLEYNPSTSSHEGSGGVFNTGDSYSDEEPLTTAFTSSK
jgi:hypothetical protein